MPKAQRREHQKSERERRIVRAARKLFASRGFASTGMEEIAERADLAVGTLYNYFPSKTELLLAIVRRETDEMLAAGRTLIDAAPADPVHAITQLIDIYVRGFAHDDRKLWRELMGAAIASPAALGPRVFESDLREVAQIGELLEQLKQRGDLSPDLDVARAATAIYGASLTWAISFVMDESMSIEVVRDEIRRAVEIVARGLLPLIPLPVREGARG